MEQEAENLNSPNEEIETADSPNSETTEESVETTTEAPEYTENEKKLYARAKKAEEELKKLKGEKSETTEAPPVDNSNLTAKDAILISRANIDVDDVERVIKFAKDEGITVSQALSNNELKAILQVRSEERRTASATETKSPRGFTKTSGEELLKRAEKTGEMPETDDAMRALAQARLDRRKQKS